MSEEQNNKSRHGFLKFIIIVLVIAAIIFGIVKFIDCATQNGGEKPTNTDGNTQLLSRSARASDIQLTEGDLSLSPLGVVFYVTPSVDIKNLEIRVTILSDTKTYSSKTVTIGNTQQGVQYNFTYSLSELNLGLSDLKTIWSNEFYYKYEVTGGTVSYFG